MANPSIKACAEGAWTKVATAISVGQIHEIKSTIEYYQTYRETGDPAPADLSEAVKIFITEKSIEISHTTPIDVYIYCIGGAGSVRVDL